MASWLTITAIALCVFQLGDSQSYGGASSGGSATTQASGGGGAGSGSTQTSGGGGAGSGSTQTSGGGGAGSGSTQTSGGGAGGSGSGSTGGSGAGSTSVSGTGVTQNPGNGNVCSPTPKTYTMTGEALYQQLLVDLANAELAIANVANANPNTPINNSSGFFLSVILSVNRDNLQLQQLINGTLTLTGQQCLSTNQQLGTDIGQVQAHANDTIQGGSCSSLTGEAQYQYLLQQLGQALNALLNAGTAPAAVNNQYPGQWLSIILGLGKAIVRIQAVVTNSDTSAECVNASKAIAQSLMGILSSVGATSTTG